VKSMQAFRNCDLGYPSLKGSFTVAGTGFDIIAGGKDIWEKDDEAHFVYTEHKGDFDFVCRVESLTAPDLYTKAGVMGREDTGASSRFVYFQIFPGNGERNKNTGGYEFQYRKEAGADCQAIYPPDAPGAPPKFPVTFPNVWIRLARSGDKFTASTSSDGTNWKQYTQFSLALNPTLLLGFAVTSHNVDTPVTAKFRDIKLDR